MADIAALVQSGAVATRVRSITGSSSDAAKAAGISAWIHSITGSAPTVVSLGGGRAQLALTEDQHRRMQTWLDTITRKPATPPKLEVSLGPTFTPWVMKKAILPAVGILAVGIAIGWFMK